MKFEKGSIIKSLKGEIYEIVEEAFNPQTEQKMFLYRSLKNKELLVQDEQSLSKSFFEIFPVIKEGQWIAFYNSNRTQIWHGRVIKRFDTGAFYVRKKNGGRMRVTSEFLLGICTKPTKTNKNPEITTRIAF